MWGRYLNYPYKEEFYILEQDAIKVYLQHHHDSAWHGWDAQVIRFFVHHYHQILLLCLFSIIVAIYLWILRNKRFMRAANLKRDIAENGIK